METQASFSFPTRRVLAGVPRVHFYEGAQAGDNRCPEDIPYPSCIRAVMEYLGEGFGCQNCATRDPAWGTNCAYSYFLGASGTAFFLDWGEGWNMDNVEIMYMSDDPMAPFQRAFDATGYAVELVGSGPDRPDVARTRQAIMASINRGRPVIGFGPIGPPESCLITGYDEGGDVLIGWSFFQGFPEFAHGLEFEPDGSFRKRGWEAGLEGALIVGEKGPRPKTIDIYRGALEWALHVMRTPQVTGYGTPRQNGLAAYDAWAEHLLRDEDFATGDMAVLRERFGVHDNVVGMVAEARWYGSIFLSDAAQRLADVAADVPEELYRAAACFAADHALMWKAWAAVGGIGQSDDRVRNLAKPGIRRDIVPIIRRARANDEEAAEHIERALASMG